MQEKGKKIFSHLIKWTDMDNCQQTTFLQMSSTLKEVFVNF